MPDRTSAKSTLETQSRIEPTTLDDVPAQVADLVAELSAKSVDQVTIMSEPFDLASLSSRVRRLAERSDVLDPSAGKLLDEALATGEFERGEAARIAGMPERTARRILNATVSAGMLASDTPKGAVSLRFPVARAEELFPSLFAAQG
ncbi:MAG: hypothetical protein ACREMP_08820 [Candidatus Tyrphobacter sp.]